MRFKPSFLFGLALFSCYGLARFCHHQTDGFSITKIRNNLPKADYSVVHSEEEEHVVEALFTQPYRYLGRGKQSFAFVSEDGCYVVKIFNNNYLSKIDRYRLLSYLPFFNQESKTKKAYFKTKLNQTFQSYQLAFKEMKEQTALHYAHLSPSSHLKTPLRIVDRLNISHMIDPNAIGFVIQKRVDLVYPTLKEKIKQGKIKEAEASIASLVRLFLWKYTHLIADNDPLIRTNYGFDEKGQAVQIDIGPLSRDPDLALKERQSKEIEKTLSSLKYWLKENCPPLIDALDRELQEQL